MLFFIIILVHECRAIKVPLRVNGGVDAESEKYPFVVRIETKFSHIYAYSAIVDQQHICTASALSPVWLVSAAHCLTTKFPIILTRPWRIIKGRMVIRYNLAENSSSTKDAFSDVMYTLTHPLYIERNIGKVLKYSRNDIGLLKTAPIKIRSYLKISAVDYKTVYGQEAVMGGFKRMAKADADDTLPLMKSLQVMRVLITKCRYDEVSAPALCLTSKCGERDSACVGDAGGPVMHPSGLLGVIVSDTTRCRGKIGQVNTAGTAIPLSPYIEWIYSYVDT